jgi:hypothetical protein
MKELFLFLLKYKTENKPYYKFAWDFAQTDKQRAGILKELLMDLSGEIERTF